MSGHQTSLPRLIIIGRQSAERDFVILDGYTEVGSASAAGIKLDVDGVSRRHASLHRAGDRVVICDLGSLNGTWVNGRKISGDHVLRDGDQLRMGYATLRFSQPAAPEEPRSSSSSFTFGDVRGPVNAGGGIQNIGGFHQSAGRDIYGDDYSVRMANDYDGMDEIFQGRGVGRVLTAVGYVVAGVGSCIIAYFILSFMVNIDSLTGNPFARELLPGIPMVPLGFGLCLLGGIIASIGSGMSKAARKRAEQHERRRRRRAR